jgi:hypothetical protein
MPSRLPLPIPSHAFSPSTAHPLSCPLAFHCPSPLMPSRLPLPIPSALSPSTAIPSHALSCPSPAPCRFSNLSASLNIFLPPYLQSPTHFQLSRLGTGDAVGLQNPGPRSVRSDQATENLRARVPYPLTKLRERSRPFSLASNTDAHRATSGTKSAKSDRR